MLIYEAEGFLEVESKHIQQLCRSTTAVSLGNPELKTSAVDAVLCDSLNNSKSCCHVAFYSKALKRAFVFAVKGSEKRSPWQIGQETLAQLGFQLEDVNLKLSGAMLEVVLRDVPGLLSPAEARKQRTEKVSLLAEFQSSYDKAPDSVQGKKAALKLNAEKRMKTQSDELRQVMETLFASKEDENAELEAHMNQVRDLTSRLEAAEVLAESERNQREMSESITVAAEKRIQELEEVLVDVETTAADALKQKRKVTQLQKRVKKLGLELDSAEVKVKKEREKQEQLIPEVKAAHEQVSLLENEREDAETALKNIQEKLVEEQAEKSQLSENLQTAELQVKTLQKEIENAEKEVAHHDAEAKTSEGAQAELIEVQQELQVSLDLNSALEEKLATAIEENANSRESLRKAEKATSDKNQEEEQMTALTEENEHLAGEFKNLRDEYAQERSIRKRLEKGALEEDKRIQELEDALARAAENVSKMPADEDASKRDAQKIVSLRLELQNSIQQFKAAQQSQEELESEVDEAHKLIDSLEKMLRETDSVAKDQRSSEKSKESGSQQVQELEKQLKAVESQLEQELVEQKRLAKAVAAAEKKITAQGEALKQEEAIRKEQDVQLAERARQVVASDTVSQSLAKPTKSTKPLPHELRPGPKKGAFFRPDWDLEGLPCESSKEVFKAWETVFNVQTSLEGYPSQYCMAFLVVLRMKKQKKLYMLYRLKLSKHTLVCVPAKPVKDEASLKQAIKEGLNFLKLSGFEMDEMAGENIDSSLSGYFLES